jgi:hypothetical protein
VRLTQIYKLTAYKLTNIFVTVLLNAKENNGNSQRPKNKEAAEQ